MPTDDREQQFERALARHFGSASPDSACPDAETLAAYHERTLSLEEMSRSKDHIAGCPRCQESLALVEQTEILHAEEWEQQNLPVPMELAASSKTMRARGASVPPDREASTASPPAAAATPIGKVTARPPWRWIVPIGALAASVIVWIGVQEIRTQHNSSIPALQVAQNRPEAPQPPVASYGTAGQVKKAEPPARKLDEKIRDQKTAPSAAPRPASPQRMESAENLNAPLPPSFEGAFTRQKDLEIAGAPKAAAPQPAATRPRAAAKSLEREMPVPATADSNAPAGVVGGALGGRAENASAKEKQQEKVPATTQTVTVESSAAAVDTTSNSALTASSTDLPPNARKEINRLKVAATDRRLIVAPGEKHAWRVGEAGKIERSTDGGKTWKLQNSGVAADLTAGSATSDKVCWVVGKAGIVLLTTDGGGHWKPITTPITEDLGGIHATDPLHASIWDVPNHQTYETSDGGATWSQTSIK
jgi:hypothetical protein